MAKKKKQPSGKKTVPGLLKTLKEAFCLDTKSTFETKLARHHQLFYSELAVGPDGPSKGKRSGRGPDSRANMWPGEPIANQIGFSGSYRHFGHCRVERAVKDGLSPHIAEFIRRQVLAERSNAEKIIEYLKTTLREREEKLSVLKVHRKELREHQRQLMKRPWQNNIHWHLTEAQALRVLLDDCDSEIESTCRNRQFLKIAIKLTHALKKYMGSKTASRSIKLAELLKDIDCYKGKFPKKSDWEPKLEKYWKKKYRDSGLVKGRGILEHMASILERSMGSIQARLSRYGFRIT
jgi:hypothetical protein